MSSEQYMPSQQAVEFITFVRACNIEPNANADIHYRLADKFFGKHKQVVIESFRGSAKSSMMEWFIMYAAVNGSIHNFGPVNFIAFVGDSSENGVKSFFRNMATKIDQAPLLREHLKIKRKTDSELELINTEGHQLNIKGYGMKTNIRGVRYNNVRPDMIVMDDVVTNEALTSEIIRKTISDNFYKALVPALHPTRYRMYVIGTPISEADILQQLAHNDSWLLHKFPICEKFPCEEKDFVGNWEDRFPYSAVKEKYDMFKGSGELQSFYQEYMLEITDLSTLLVEEKDIQWYHHKDVIKKISEYNVYISTDFATSQKKSADYSVISVWAISSNNDWILIDGICKRQSMPDTIRDLFRLAARYKPLGVGIETSGQQGGFLDIISDMMIKENNWFTLAKRTGSSEPGIRPIKDKLHRFVTGVQPKFKQGKVRFPRVDGLLEAGFMELKILVDEFEHELSKFTSAAGVKALKHDDAIDTLNQLSEMAKFAPMSIEDVPAGHMDKIYGRRGYDNDEPDAYESYA